ncbi:MAG: S41 family peptidase [Flavobacteriaceae bacterium]
MKNNNNVPLYIGIAVAIGILIGSILNFANRPGTIFSKSAEAAKIKRLIDYIQYDYVDEVDTDYLLDGAINHVVSKLDPHSVYFTKEELEQENEQFEGNFVGIGVQFVMNKDSVVITKILKGGPSENLGMKPSDRILLANNDSLSNAKLNSNQVIKILKGEPDTNVNLTIYRPISSEVLEFSLSRGDVPLKSISAHYMLNEEIGFIKIDRFAKTTYDEFKEALDNLIAIGMKELVLDFRDNPGGFMNIANKIADEFLEDGKLIVFTKNKKGDIEEDFATEEGSFEKGHVYILMNENSASASEIVAGALQDNDKGTIIGRRSFGKGLVQQTMGLGDGSAVRLTIARYYTPTGRSIQKPYDLNHSEEYYEQFSKRFENGELMFADSIKVNDSLKFTTPKGKVVYGGGGIVPDVFVPIDTTQYIENRYLIGLNRFSFDYVDQHREELKNWTVESFIHEFDADGEITNKYLNGIDADDFLIPNHKMEIIKKAIKASIAQSLFDDNEFNQVILANDKMLGKVVELENSK